MKYDVIIIGAGAAGLMCAIEAGRRGRNVLLLDKAKAVGEKIRISGGGRCNFTNIHATPANYLSQNPRFCVSALKRYTQFDFIKLVETYDIAYHEKTLGQQFCDKSAKQIIAMLVAECESVDVRIALEIDVTKVEKQSDSFKVDVSGGGEFFSASLVIATGGPSIPKMGATGWGYDVAKQFGLNLIPQRAGLVPFTLNEKMLQSFKNLAGVSLNATASCNGITFEEGFLFTHRGLSGPVILQISSYWNEGDVVTINLAPDVEVFQKLKEYRQATPKQEMHKALSQILPKRLAVHLCDAHGVNGRIADLSNARLQELADAINKWQVVPSGTEGYRTAEVTLGGVNTDELSSKTFESKKVSGLYFIGEVVDVTGWLGGYNFQWAWSSGWATGQYA